MKTTQPPGSILDDGRIVSREAGAISHGSVYIKRRDLSKAIEHGWMEPPLPPPSPDDLIQVVRWSAERRRRIADAAAAQDQMIIG